MTERTELDVTRETLKCADFCIHVAALGAISNPEDGVDYLPTTPEEVKAHKWVKNAVLMAFTMGAWKATTAPEDFGLYETDARETGIAMANGADLYQFMTTLLEIGE